nr:hypothetical protein [Tanacetum cinerariifolium]
MSSITAQQTKLDLKLVPKKNTLDIRKCNGRIPYGLTPRKPTFQVILDAMALTPCNPAFIITADDPEVYMHQFWNSVYKHDTFYRFKINKKKRLKLTLEVFGDIFQIFPRVPGRNFDVLPSEEDNMSFLRELDYTGEINSLNDIIIYGAILSECLTSSTMQESKAYKTYLGYAIEPPVETKSKRKEKVDVTRGKGIELLFEVALTKEAEMKELRKESLRDFHKSHPSGSGTVSKKPPSVEKIIPTITNKGTESSNESGEHENESEEQDSDSKQKEESNDDVQEEEEIVHTLSNSDDEDEQLEGDEEKGMDDTTGEGADAEMDDAQQGNENLETPHEQVVDDVHVTITKKTEVPVTSSSRSLDLASKFLNFSDILMDKDEDPSIGSDRGLSKRKTRKYAEPTTSPKTKDSTSRSSKGIKSQLKSSGKSVQLEELVFEVADSDMP